MKRKWKIIAALICLSTLLGACSVNKNEGTKAADTNENKQNKKKTEVKEYQDSLDLIQPGAYSNINGLNMEEGSYISVIGKSAGGPFWEAVKKGAEQAGADINKALGYEGKEKVKVVYSGPTQASNVDEQVNILDEELARYPVAVGISTVDAKACEVQFDLAAESDIPIVAYDSGSDYQRIMATVQTDNDSSARAVADKLAEETGETGEIAIFVQDSKSKAALERERAFVDQIKKQHSGNSIVSIYHTDELEQMQKKVAEEMNAGTYLEKSEDVQPETITEEDVVDYIFAKHPNIKGCYGTSGDAVMLAVDGIDRAEKDTEIVVMGYDADEAVTEALTEGKIDGLIAQNPFGMGYATVVASARAALALGNEAVVNTGYIWVTEENLEEDAIQSLLY